LEGEEQWGKANKEKEKGRGQANLLCKCRFPERGLRKKVEGGSEGY
jgi:hypothetical protein